MLAADNHQLLHGQPIIVLGPVEVEQQDLAGSEHAVIRVVLDVHAFGQQLVDAAVLLQQVRQFALGQFADGVAALPSAGAD